HLPKKPLKQKAPSSKRWGPRNCSNVLAGQDSIDRVRHLPGPVLLRKILPTPTPTLTSTSIFISESESESESAPIATVIIIFSPVFIVLSVMRCYAYTQTYVDKARP